MGGLHVGEPDGAETDNEVIPMCVPLWDVFVCSGNVNICLLTATYHEQRDEGRLWVGTGVQHRLRMSSSRACGRDLVELEIRTG